MTQSGIDQYAPGPKTGDRTSWVQAGERKAIPDRDCRRIRGGTCSSAPGSAATLGEWSGKAIGGRQPRICNSHSPNRSAQRWC
jgi:hypothetical protein